MGKDGKLFSEEINQKLKKAENAGILPNNETNDEIEDNLNNVKNTTPPEENDLLITDPEKIKELERLKGVPSDEINSDLKESPINPRLLGIRVEKFNLESEIKEVNYDKVDSTELLKFVVDSTRTRHKFSELKKETVELKEEIVQSQEVTLLKREDIKSLKTKNERETAVKNELKTTTKDYDVLIKNFNRIISDLTSELNLAEKVINLTVLVIGD